MAEPRPKSGSFQIHLSYSLDRLLEPKLAKACDILMPCRERPVGAHVKEFDDENGGHLRTSLVRAHEENTIASQTASLMEFAKSHDLEGPAEWVFEDQGYRGATLERPGRERVRDLAAEGQFRLCLRTRQTD